MGNYIKTLILSTMVFVIGNNSNYCYSDYNDNNIVNNNENAVPNKKFLQKDKSYEPFSIKFRKQMDNLLTSINNQNVTQVQKSVLKSIYNNFNYISKVCENFSEIWLVQEYNDVEKQQFNVNIVNNEIPGVIPQNILNQYYDITFGQLSKYMSDQIYSIVINNIERTVSIIDSWDGQDIDKLIDEIIVKMFPDYCRVENIIQSFYNFCDNHLNNLDEINQNFVKKIKHMNSSFTGYLKRFKQKFMEFYDQVEKIQQDINDNDDLIDFNSYEQRCLDIMLKLHRNLENRQNPPHNVDLIYDFARTYISFSEVFDNALTTEMINDFPNENVTNDDLDEAITFVRQLPNSMHAHVISTLINIKDQMFNNNLNQQQLEELIKNSVSYCIKYIINYVKTTLSELANNNNPLTKIWNNYYVETAFNSIIERMDRFYQLRQKYNL